MCCRPWFGTRPLRTNTVPVLSFLAILFSYKTIFYLFFKKYYRQRNIEFCLVNEKYVKYIPLTQPYLNRAIMIWNRLIHRACSVQEGEVNSQSQRRKLARWFMYYLEETDQAMYKVNYTLLNEYIESVKNELNEQYVNNYSSQDDRKEYIFADKICVGDEYQLSRLTYNKILDAFIARELCKYDKKLKRFYDYFLGISKSVPTTKDPEIKPLLPNEPFYHNHIDEWFTKIILSQDNYYRSIFPEYVPDKDKANRKYHELNLDQQLSDQDNPGDLVSQNSSELFGECSSLDFQLLNLMYSVLFGITNNSNVFDQIFNVQQQDALRIAKQDIRCVKMVKVGHTSQMCFTSIFQIFFRFNLFSIPFSDNMKLPQWMSLDLTNNYLLLTGVPPDYYKGNYSIQIFNQSGRIIKEIELHITDMYENKMIEITGEDKIKPADSAEEMYNMSDQLLKQNSLFNTLQQEEAQDNHIQLYKNPIIEDLQLDQSQPISDYRDTTEKELISQNS